MLWLKTKKKSLTSSHTPTSLLAKTVSLLNSNDSALFTYSWKTFKKKKHWKWNETDWGCTLTSHLLEDLLEHQCEEWEIILFCKLLDNMREKKKVYETYRSLSRVSRHKILSIFCCWWNLNFISFSICLNEPNYLLTQIYINIWDQSNDVIFSHLARFPRLYLLFSVMNLLHSPVDHSTDLQ